MYVSMAVMCLSGCGGRRVVGNVEQCFLMGLSFWNNMRFGLSSREVCVALFVFWMG